MAEPTGIDENAPDAVGEKRGTAEGDLVLITGMSGAGRSEAIHTFEDLGYFCIDNLPPALIGQLVSLTALPGSRIRRMAVVCDVRGGAFFEELSAELDDLELVGHPFRILFLTADDRTLVRRFKETRRRHPLSEVGSVAEGIAAERGLLEAVRERADLIIDTSGLRPQELSALICEKFVAVDRQEQMAVTVVSFGFKHGLPVDADIVMDVRFLPNPYYDDRLRPKTGLDRPVRSFVLGKPETTAFLERWFSLLELLLPNYVSEGKSQLSVALGCTGGQHRSVVLAEKTGEHLLSLGYQVSVSHRDIAKDRNR
ncbi:MAG: RNase adapter RapZ [Coriobacteriia bacterium]|nr:RNase adapter RapZ [Coriobacteriia bacterium]